jgi:DNA-binding NtrC family response regulator
VSGTSIALCQNHDAATRGVAKRPLNARPEHKGGAVARKFRRRTDGARILLVEDNEDFSLLMNLVLQEAGYAVDCATCAEDALRMMERQRYRLLLSDYSLPGYSGLWLLSQAFERQLMAPHSALIITGDPEAPGIGEAVPVVPKPLNFERLLPQIRKALENGTHPVPCDVAA